eukprot:3349777-Prymnesium_polylepis.2
MVPSRFTIPRISTRSNDQPWCSAQPHVAFEQINCAAHVSCANTPCNYQGRLTSVVLWEQRSHQNAAVDDMLNAISRKAWLANFGVRRCQMEGSVTGLVLDIDVRPCLHERAANLRPPVCPRCPVASSARNHEGGSPIMIDLVHVASIGKQSLNFLKVATACIRV